MLTNKNVQGNLFVRFSNKQNDRLVLNAKQISSLR